MIIYNGIDLASIAPVMIEDIRVNSIDYDAITRPRAVSAGSVFVRSRAGTRTISVTFALLDDNKVNRQKSLLAISQWAKTDAEYRLELPGHPEHYLTAVCTEKPDPSLRQWWESKLRLVFTCFSDPFWNAKAERTASIGSWFLVQGDAPPLMEIRKPAAQTLDNAVFTMDGRSMKFSTLPVGKMVIDLNKQTAECAGNSIMQYYDITSEWLIPRPGKLLMTGNAGNVTTIYYRERWE
jgi:phage-related protein